MNWTVGKKMASIGIIVVLGMGALAGNTFFTNTAIELADGIRASMPELVRGVQVDLPALIEKNGKEAVRIEEAEEASAGTLAKSKVVGGGAALIALAVAITALLLIGRSIINPIRRVSEGLSAGAAQVASASTQVSSASQQLAQGSSEQARGIGQVNKAVTEMDKVTRQNAMSWA